MHTPSSFLITYGLHNAVSHARHAGRHVFTINAAAGGKIARHAQTLIREVFDSTALIRMASA